MDMAAIVAQVLYFEQAKTGLEPDADFDRSVAEFLDRLAGS